MPENPPKSLPDREPTHPEVLIRPNVRVSMRDGVELATDLYLPARDGRAATEPAPALLRRTPYNKGAANNPAAMRLARCGYVVALQDVRGRFASDGAFDCLVQEAEDGYDTIEWLAEQPPCDGRVGTFGASYEAYAQAAAATQSPPHLAAMCHAFGYTHGYHSARQGGALDVFYLSYFVRMATDGKEAQADPNVRRALADMRFDEWLTRYPIRPGQSPLALAPSYERTYFNYVEHECLDDFWRQPGISPAEHLKRWPNVPTLWLCGWFDHYAYCHPDSLAFTRLTRMGRDNQFVVFGPWTHGNTGLEIGGTTFGPESTGSAALPDYELRWFDRHLKGVDDEGLFSSPARYFVMGGGSGARNKDGLFEHGGRWRESVEWPPPCASPLPFYLSEQGRLTRDTPSESESETRFRADPEDPAPSSTGICYTVASMPDGSSRRISTNGAWDQTEGPHLYAAEEPYLPLASRQDTLVFQTGPLTEDLEIAGHPILELWISSDAPDADFVAKLIDVYPPGEDHPGGLALGVSEGVQRAKFREGFDAPKPLETGEHYLVRIELRPVANLFQMGHRLRIDITGSSWPYFDVNTHTGRNPSTDWERKTAHNTIHHDSTRPSRILLPTLGKG
jgi:uncharacterized protein